MAKRNYKLDDIYEYLKEYYGLEWRLCLVSDNGVHRSVSNGDYYGRYREILGVEAIMYQGSRRRVLPLTVSNDDLSVGCGFAKPERAWPDFLALKRYDEQLTRGDR